MSGPLLSIVIPSFNQGRYIRETIDSVLAQDYRPIEIIVMDGASKDETVAVLQSYAHVPELRWRSEPDKGVVDGVNKGLAEARGPIVAIQSSDDVYLPGAFTAVLEAFRDQPDLGLVYGDVDYIDETSRLTGGTHLPPFSIEDYIGKRTFIPQPAAFFRKDAADAVGPWRADISYAADAEFYLRLALRFPVLKLDRTVARYRYHGEQRDRAGERIARDWSAAVAPFANDPRLGPHARSGIWLSRHHYLPESRWIARTWSLWRAVAAHPALLRHPEIRWQREWIPGRYPIWKMLSRIKRAGKRLTGSE
jgi:glycosyltransferase involved in cell wall biosynthesis